MEKLLDNITDFREGNRYEAKLAKGGLPHSIWETYSAFANTDGGLIVLGVKENKDHTFSIEGVEDAELYIKNFWDIVNNKNKVSANLLQNKHIYSKEIEDKQVIFIEIPRAERQFRPVYINNDIFSGTYHRSGEGDYRCSKEEVLEMLRDASVTSTDSKVLIDMDKSVFCNDSVRAYRNIFNNLHINHVWSSLDDADFLRKIGALGLDSETGKLHPTLAGLLMFGYEYEIVRELPQYFLDYQEKFDSNTRWSDRIVSTSGEWSGNIFDFFFKVGTKLLEDIKKPFKLEGMFRVDDTSIHKAIREIFVNTLVNADYYGRQGIVILKYKDKIVFENPGAFRIPIKDAFNGGVSDPRNATILKMFAMIDIGERAGSGIPSVVSVWENTFKNKPNFRQTLNPSRVIAELLLSSDKTSDKSEFQAINPTSSDKTNRKQEEVEKKLLEILNDKQEHSISELSKLVNLSPARTRALVSNLVEEGQVVAIGANKNRRYILK